MRSTLRFIGVGADHNSRAFFAVAQHAHQAFLDGLPLRCLCYTLFGAFEKPFQLDDE